MKRSDLVWKNLNTVLGRGQERITCNELNTDGATISGKCLANTFNDFFVSLGKSSYDPQTLDYLTARNCNSAFLTPTNSDEIYRAFNTLRNSRSLDTDNIQIRPVKYTLEIICPVLEHIFNLVFLHGVFPARMQLARVSVVFKGGDKDVLSNYRPISILPVFSKALEKLINERMTSFCDKYSILTPSQFGFRKNRSTECALLVQKELVYCRV